LRENTQGLALIDTVHQGGGAPVQYVGEEQMEPQAQNEAS